MSTAFVFPGQGSQSVGMGRALAERFAVARRLFDEVDDALDFDLSGLMAAGPEAELTLTANAQPALMAVSLAALRVLESEAGLDLARDVAFLAGHSLGEYSALAAAGSFSVAAAARLLRLRGRAMQAAAGEARVGGMAALIGIDAAVAARVVAEAAGADICDVANDNGPGQVVISGHAEALARAIDIAKRQGVKRAVALPVSAPFHSALMRPAAAVMAEALNEVAIGAPTVAVIANVTARPLRDPAAIRQALVAQICGTVRWRETIQWLVEAGVRRQVEIGAGKVLSGLGKRIAPGLATVAVGVPDDIAAFVAVYAAEAAS